MNKTKDQPPRQQADTKVAITAGSILFMIGIAMGWFIFHYSYIARFWPGLLLGFCFALFVAYMIIKSSKQKAVDGAIKPEKSPRFNWGGLGAGMGVLLVGAFGYNEMLMVNITAAASSLCLGIGFSSVVLAIYGKN